jgi:hypothetical protein
VKLTTLAVILILYGLGLYLWNKRNIWRLDQRLSNGIKYFHWSLTLLVVISIVLNWSDNISFSGRWTTRIIVIGFLLSGILIYPLTNRTERLKIERYYFKLFSFLPTITGFLLIIPFTGGLLFNTLFGQLMYPVYKVYLDSDKLRVQSSYIGPFWPAGIFVYEKKGLFEKQLVNSPISDLFIDSVGTEQHQNETLIILYNKEEGLQDTLRFKKIE